MNCDRIAHAYRWLEYSSFGFALERRRFCYLPDVSKAHRALILGDGDGRFLAKFAKASTACTDCVDSSAEMLKLARGRAGSERVRYVLGDVLTCPFERAEYDLIATHFFLDCFTAAELDRLVGRIHEAARPGASWLISEFRQPYWALPLVSALYLFFRVTTGLRVSRLADHRPILRRYGFQLTQEETSWRGLLASELWTRS